MNNSGRADSGNARELPTTIVKCKQILSRPYFGKDRTSAAIAPWNERVKTCI